jgi:hypothetical protein
MFNLPKDVVAKFGVSNYNTIQINHMGDIALIGSELKRKENFVTIFGLSADNHIMVVEDVPKTILESSNNHAFFLKIAREYGATDIFVYTDSKTDIDENAIFELVSKRSITDIITLYDNDEIGVYRNYGLKKNYKEWLIEKRREKYYYGKTINDYEVTNKQETGITPLEDKETIDRNERELYANAKREIVELPELVEIAFSLLGKYPKVKNYLGKALGKFRGDTGTIDLSAKLTPETAGKTLAHEIGHVADWLPEEKLKRGGILAKISSINNYFKTLLAEYPDSPNKILTDDDRARIRKDATEQVRASGNTIVSYITRTVPEYAETDITPKVILDILGGRLNEQGELVKEPKDLYALLQQLDTRTRAQVAKKAFKDLVDERFAGMRQRVQVGEKTITEKVTSYVGKEDKNAAIRKRYAELVKEEITKRRLFEKETILKELKVLTQQWKPFDENGNENYTKHRYSSAELYADAISVLFNNPDMLQQIAPTFNKAFLNYLDRKPAFKKLFDSVQERLADPIKVKENRSNFIRQMAEHGAAVRQKENEIEEGINRPTFPNIFRAIQKALVNKDLVVYNEKVKSWIAQGKELKDSDFINYYIERLPYIDSRIFAYLYRSEQIINDAQKDNISIIDLHEVLELERAAFEKASIVSPGGISGVFAEEQLKFLEETVKAKYGVEHYKKLMDYADKFRQVYIKEVISDVKEADFLPQSLMEYMENNPYYVTFKKIKFKENEEAKTIDGHLNSSWGADYTGKIYHRYGGLGEVDNVVVSTLLQGAALIRSSRYHITKMAVLQKLVEWGDETEVIQAKKLPGGYGFEAPPRGYDLIVVSPHGKLEGYFIDKELADTFNRNIDRADALYRLGIAAKHFVAKVFIEWNVPWIVSNPWRDIFGTWKKTPHSSGLVLKAAKNTFLEAVHSGFGKLPERELKLLKEESKPAGHFWVNGRNIIEQEILDLENKGALRERTDFYSKFHRVMTWFRLNKFDRFLVVPPIFRFLSRVGRVGENWGKYIGDELTELIPKSGQREAFGVQEKAHYISTRAGTPNAFAEGFWTKATEIVFPFSRMAIQDVISGYEAYSEHKGAYAMKTVILNVLPKVFMAMALYGLFGDELKEATRKIPGYFRKAYSCIPLGDLAGQTVFLKIPQDYTGQAVGAAIESLISALTETIKTGGFPSSQSFFGASGLLGTMTSYQPFNMNPFLETILDWGKYYTSSEIPVNFYGSKIMSDLEGQAGGTIAAKALLRSTWNNFFGTTFFKFEADNVKKIEPEIKKLLGTVPANAVGRFIGISDSGIGEEARLEREKTKQREARRILGIRADIVEKINNQDFNISVNDLSKYWSMAVRQKIIDPKKQPFKAFMRTYLNSSYKRTGSEYVRAFLAAQTSAEKSDLLRMWKSTRTEERYKEILNELTNHRLMTKGVYYQQNADRIKERREKEEEND